MIKPSKQLAASILIGATSVLGLVGSASAATSTTPAQRLTNLQTRGASEISRRQTSLGKLNGVITADTKLTASDKSYLTNEVTTETSGLDRAADQTGRRYRPDNCPHRRAKHLH